MNYSMTVSKNIKYQTDISYLYQKKQRNNVVSLDETLCF